MFMPAVFHENLFDDLFDPFWNDAALERAMSREAHDTFGKRGANMMKTDVKQTENRYDVAVDLPGCKKEDVQMELSDGYLTIQAVRSHSNDEKDKEGPLRAARDLLRQLRAQFLRGRREEGRHPRKVRGWVQLLLISRAAPVEAQANRDMTGAILEYARGLAVVKSSSVGTFRHRP